MDVSLAISTAAPPSAKAHPAGCTCATCTRRRGLSTPTTTTSPATRGIDTVNLSTTADSSAATAASPAPAGPAQSGSAAAARDERGRPLDDRQKAQVDELKKTDADVRRHEQAHLSAAGGLARGGIVLNYKPGPDGKLYAVGGHVDIDTSPVKGDPTATLAKMATVQRAALAPADPSGQDRAVAVQAEQAANQARAELARQSGPQGGANGIRGLTLTIAKGTRTTSNPPGRAGSADSAASGAATPGVAAGQLVDVMG